MQSLVFLAYFFQKLSKKNLCGVGSTPPPGKGRVNIFDNTVVNVGVDIIQFLHPIISC